MESLSFKNNYWTHYSVACCSPNLSPEDSCKAFTVTAILTAITGGLFFIVMIILYRCSIPDPSLILKLPRDDSTDIMERHIESGVPLDATDRFGNTALHIALRDKHYKRAKLLIENGAPVNALNLDDYSPLHTAVYCRPPNNEIILLLVKNGARSNVQTRHFLSTPLHSALVSKLPEETIKALIGDGSVLHLKNFDGNTPLHIAIRMRAPHNIIKLLVDAKAPLDSKEKFLGATPLAMAIGSEYPLETIKLLVNAVSLSEVDSSHRTPLQFAIHIKTEFEHRDPSEYDPLVTKTQIDRMEEIINYLQKEEDLLLFEDEVAELEESHEIAIESLPPTLSKKDKKLQRS